MLIVLGLYFLILWLVFFKLKLLPWNKTWKIGCISFGMVITVFVIGALKYFTPTSISGVVQSYSQRVYPQVSGEVIWSKSESELVSKGDTLFSINPTSFKLALDSASANLDLVKLKYGDVKSLVEKGVEREKSLDIVSTELAVAEAAFKQAEYNFNHTNVTAPFNGKIVLSTLSNGQVVTPMRPAMTIQNDYGSWLVAIVEQTGMGKINYGTAVSIVFSSEPGVVFESKVINIAPSLIQGQIYSEDRTPPIDTIMDTRHVYGIKVELPKGLPEHVLREGTTAIVTVYSEPENPINVLAKVLTWITAWLMYL